MKPLGRARAGQVTPPSTPAEMQERIMSKLSGPERRILRVLIDRYPRRITKEALAASCEPPYSNIRSGGFAEPLGRLTTLGIVIKTQIKGEVVASPALFLEAAR